MSPTPSTAAGVGTAGLSRRYHSASSAAWQPEPAAVIAFVKERIGSVKPPKEVWVWDDPPRSKVGKVLKSEIKTTLLT